MSPGTSLALPKAKPLSCCPRGTGWHRLAVVSRKEEDADAHGKLSQRVECEVRA